MGYGDPELAQRLLALINEERVKAGVPPLSSDWALAAAAQVEAQALSEAGNLSHLAPDGASLVARVERAGYGSWSVLAENVAAGPASPEEVLAAWLASPTHWENLLNPEYAQAGVGYYYYSESGHFWVLDLASH